jgi:hypothetical protein
MEKDKDKHVDKTFIPLKERKKIRDKQIVALYKSGLSMAEVVIAMSKLGYSVSKTTVFFAINGRWTPEAKERRIKRNRFKSRAKKPY